MRRGVQWDASEAEEEALARALLERIHLHVDIKTIPPEEIAADYDPQLTQALEGWTALEISIERPASTSHVWVDAPEYRLDAGLEPPREIDPAVVANALGEIWLVDVAAPGGPPPIPVGKRRVGPGCGFKGIAAMLLLPVTLATCLPLGHEYEVTRPHPNQKPRQPHEERLSDAHRELAPRTLDVLYDLRHTRADISQERLWRETRVVTYETEELRSATATIDVRIQYARWNRNRWIRATFNIPGRRLAEGETISGPLTNFDAEVRAELRREEPPEPDHFR